MRNARATQLLFELSQPGRRAARMPMCDVPETPVEEIIPAEFLASESPPLPDMRRVYDRRTAVTSL